MPSYVIHVGLHKTGSTYLQYRFREARAALAARGIVYPPQWENPRNFGHIVLANALACGNADSLIQDFAALNASDAGIVLISAEDLCNLDKAGLDTLKALTAGNRVDIVFVFRRWSALIPSIWQESIKQGNTATLTHFLLPHVMKPHMSRLLNLDLRLAPIVAAFGQDFVHLVGYHQVRDREIDLFGHFARNFLGWPDPPAANRTMNASMTAVDTELIRALSALNQQQGGSRSAELRGRFTAAADSLDLSLPRDAMAGHVTKIRFRDNGPTLRALHAELTAKYLALTVPPKLGGHLFAPRVEEFRYVATDYLLAPGVVPALQAALNALFPEQRPCNNCPGG